MNIYFTHALKRKKKQWNIINAYLYNYIMCIFINRFVNKENT